MSDERRQPENQPFNSLDPLDQLLARARWNHADPAAMDRLRAFIPRSSRHVAAIWKIAAAVLVAAAGGMIWSHWFSKVPLQRSSAVHVVHSVETKMGFDRPPSEIEAGLWRLAEAHDRAAEKAAKSSVPTANSAQSRPITNRPVTKVAAPPTVTTLAAELHRTSPTTPRYRAILAELLRRGDLSAVRIYLPHVSNLGTREVALAVAVESGRASVELLIGMLSDPLSETRLSAARALGAIDGPVLTERLARMALQDQNRREAMLALAFSRGSEAKYFMSQASQRGPLVSLARSVIAQVRS